MKRKSITAADVERVLERRVMYHFTGVTAWRRHIRHEGLLPYRILKPQAGLDVMGIWLWPRVTDRLMSDFLLWRRAIKKARHGILLECQLEARHLYSVSGEPGTRCRLRHELSFEGGGIFHRNVPCDICLRPIPPEHIRPVKEIKEVIINPRGEPR